MGLAPRLTIYKAQLQLWMQWWVRLVPRSGNHFGGVLILAEAAHWVWWGEGHFGRVLGQVAPQGNTRAGQMVLTRSMENVSYGAHKHQASEMEELKSCA